MNYKGFVCCFTTIILLGVFCVGGVIIYIDPFFHYHKPNNKFYYTLSNQRYQNNGVLKHFDYDAIITGTSMTENFKTTELDKLFGVKSIKVSYSGGSFKEINDAIKVAYKSGHYVKAVVRALDYYRIIAAKDAMRTDLGTYPVYLYNDALYDDGKYVLNKDILINYCIPMLKNKMKGQTGGITSFDRYSNWNKSYKFGRKYVVKNKVICNIDKAQKQFTEKDKKMVIENISQNVVELASKHPETTFYYFFPPYSNVYYADLINRGGFERHLAAEKLAIEMILEYPNIKLFSFNLMTDIVTDLNNYKDTTQYGEWINSDILRYMKNDIGLLTKDNYKYYLEKEREFYMNYPYESI